MSAAKTPWDIAACPLLSDLKSNPEFEFLRREPAFQQLIALD